MVFHAVFDTRPLRLPVTIITMAITVTVTIITVATTAPAFVDPDNAETASVTATGRAAVAGGGAVVESAACQPDCGLSPNTNQY